MQVQNAIASALLSERGRQPGGASTTIVVPVTVIVPLVCEEVVVLVAVVVVGAAVVAVAEEEVAVAVAVVVVALIQALRRWHPRRVALFSGQLDGCVQYTLRHRLQTLPADRVHGPHRSMRELR